MKKALTKSFYNCLILFGCFSLIAFTQLVNDNSKLSKINLINYAAADSRLKDIVFFEGVRDNVLVGYGLVVGLNGSGDNLRNSGFTENGLVDYLKRLGVSTKGANFNTKNVAAVMVTSNLPAFARPGSRISINVSALGDAKSLKGGTLLATPLLAADGQVYGVAQGVVSIGSLADPEGSKIKPIPTTGYISNGAIVEASVNFNMNSLSEVHLSLKNGDITTSRAIATAVNSAMREEIAYAIDPGTVKVKVPYRYSSNVTGLLADIEGLTISPDSVAKIVIDEATGTIVIGDNVKISPIAIAQGNLVINVSNEEKFDFLIGANPKEPIPSIPGTKLAVLEENATLKDLVQGLNALGVKTPDLIAILKTINQAGALQASIEVR